VVSDIWIPKTNIYNGVEYPRLHKGHPGVFVTYNKAHSKGSLPTLYAKQQAPGYVGPKDIEFYYIIPPKATVREYLYNFRNAYLNKVNGGTRPVLNIGNLWTSYKLLKNIHQAGKLTTENLKSKLLDKLELEEIIVYLDELIKIEEQDSWDSDPDYQNLLA
jgi:hypothetical protein